MMLDERSRLYSTPPAASTPRCEGSELTDALSFIELILLTPALV